MVYSFFLLKEKALRVIKTMEEQMRKTLHFRIENFCDYEYDNTTA